MVAIFVDVGEVVNDVDSAGEQAEQAKRGERAQERIDLKEFDIEYERGEHNDVLAPLAWAHGFEQGAEHGAIIASSER